MTQRAKALGAGSCLPATILLVDDDPTIRRFAEVLLSAQGHYVLEAASGSQALELVRAHGHEIEILVTDVNMPGMDGPALAEMAVTENPGLPVLYISGSPEHPSLGPVRYREDFVLLPKPFTPQTLCRIVNEVLSASRRTRRKPAVRSARDRSSS